MHEPTIFGDDSGERLWIKICGLSRAADVAAALDAGADAIGFVFASSRRQVSVHHAFELARPARDKAVKCVAVMHHPTQAQLDEVSLVFQPDVLQTDIEDLCMLHLPGQLEVLPVIRSSRAGTSAAHARGQALPPGRLLFEGPRSGSGELADWRGAARLARVARLVLAGGLSPGNVAAAIATVHPFGVDVSSGVEVAPGIKDPARIHAFVHHARAAAKGASR